MREAPSPIGSDSRRPCWSLTIIGPSWTASRVFSPIFEQTPSTEASEKTIAVEVTDRDEALMVADAGRRHHPGRQVGPERRGRTGRRP